MSLPRRLRRTLALLCAAPVLFAAAPPARSADPQEPRVLQFSPRGTVKQVRQVTARFSAPMVPLGDPRPARDPFEVACPEAGTGRWMDSRTWIYDFARDLPGGIRCTFRLRGDLAALSGQRVVPDPAEFAFSTGGPAIKASAPRQGSQAIDEEQAFLVVLDAEPTPASVLQHAAFSVGGIAERIGVRLVTGAARDEILRAQFPQGTTQPVLILQARQRFPNEARVSLVWGKGITSAQGVATEQEQLLPFQVRKPFTAQFTCERENPRAGCVPVTPMRVTFSAPVPWEQARKIALVGPGGLRRSPAPDKTPRVTVPAVTFPGPFPESSAFRVELPAGLVDDAGRPLANAARFPLDVRTEAFPPLAKFSARFGILERADPVLPVTLRNLEPAVMARLLRVDRPEPADVGGAVQGLLDRLKGTLLHVPPERAKEVLPWLRRVAGANREASLFTAADAGPARKEFGLPKPAGAKPFEVVGIPLERPGLYIVELESAKLGAALLGKPQSMFVPAAALVTNLSVHFKWGREASLVWVTTLDQGRPVPRATVSIADCGGAVLWSGQTDSQGLARVPGLPHGWNAVRRCEGQRTEDPFERYPLTQTEALRGLEHGLTVFAQTADDFSFVHSSWDRGIEPWRFRLPYDTPQESVAAHSVFDRSLLRAGETVHMKHVLRRRTLSGFAQVPEAERPTRLQIQHLGSEQKYDLPLAWDAAGIAETAWAIPRDAKLGSYQVMMQRQGERAEEWLSGGFRVEEFRLATARGTVRLPADPQVGVREVPVDVAVQYLAGGVGRELPVTVRAQILPREFPVIEEFEDFTFANGPVAVGTSRQREEYYGEETEDFAIEEEASAPERAPVKPTVHQRDQLVLDNAGTARTIVANLPRVTRPQELLAEMEFRDPNGELRTVAGRVPLWPAQRLVGLQPEGWAASTERLKAWTAVVDVARRPVAGAPVQVEVFERKIFSHRKRLVGGFYAFEHVTEVRRVGELCRGATDAKGRFLCEGKPPAEGNLILQASTTDPAGNRSAANQDVWVAGSGDWWFRAEDSDRMDVLPEKRRLEPGESARLQVRMPFRQATALVTVEREGILDAFVTSLSGSQPVVQVPVKPEYAPNVFLSVLAVRGRVGDVQPTALADLGKPAFKLGVAEIRVGWRAHELRVAVTPERQAYRVREKARVKIAVRTADGKLPPAGSEVAVAAVDEGLLELMPNASWNLLEPMMQRRGYGVSTATAQMQVVGKRHFGLKALPHGGGGGRQTTRELFDTLLLWKGRVPLDARGEAALEIPLNDSLSSFRITAVATGGASLFGTGRATIRATQDLMLLAGLPPLVREGDRFRAEVTVRNTTARPMDVTLTPRVEGLSSQPAPQRVSLAPASARTVEWEIQVPAGLGSLRYEVAAAESGGAADRLRVTQQVRPAVPVRTLQATLLRLEQPARLPVARPADALPERGGVQVAASPSLVASIAGTRTWMREYPYMCLEQEVSRAVALRDEARWTRLAATLPAHLDADGLLKYFPRMLRGSDALTAYVMSVVHEAGWSLPPDVQQKMETGLRRFVEGSVVRYSALPTTDLSIRKLAALEALSRHGKVAPALLGSIAIEPTLWPTAAVLDWRGLLHRLPAIPNRAARLAEAEQILRARLNLQGTILTFSSEVTDALWWLMQSADVNAVRLVLHLLETQEWRDDLPRLMRGALGRQRRGTWDLTVANAWGVLAVEKFARAFEAVPVAGVTTASLPPAAQRIDWQAQPRGGSVALPWPAAPAELSLEHAGSGAPWVTVEARAAVPLAAPLGTGYRISRSVRPIEQRVPGRWSRGDLLRVRLAIEAQSDMTWVVVSDPVPAGASHLGSGLGGDSLIGTQGERRTGDAWPAFEERAFEAFRAYYEFVPKGTTVVEYTIRLNQAGRFLLPTTRVEAMYAPEMFGEQPNEALEVQP